MVAPSTSFKPLYTSSMQNGEDLATIEKKLSTYNIPLTTERCREGAITYIEGDQPIGGSLKLFGEWAQSEVELLSKFIHPGDTVLDIGANIGCHTLAFCNLVGHLGHVHAFEPQPLAADITASNLLKNNCKNFSVWQIGLGEVSSSFKVPNPAHTAIKNLGGVSLLANSSDRHDITVQVAPLDSLALDKVSLIKCDVEGMEPAVLRGAQELIRRSSPIIYLECNDLTHGIELLGLLHSLKYKVYLHRAEAFNSANFKNESGNPFGVAHEINVLAIPSIKEGYEQILQPWLTAEALIPTPTIDAFAAAFLETPRYGDLSLIDRDPVALREKIKKLESINASIFGQEMELQKRLKQQRTVSIAITALTERIRAYSLYTLDHSPTSLGSFIKSSWSKNSKLSKKEIDQIKGSPFVDFNFIKSQSKEIPDTVEDFLVLYAKERALWSIQPHLFFIPLYYQIFNTLDPTIPPLIHYLLAENKSSLVPHPFLRGVSHPETFIATLWRDRSEKPAIFDIPWYLGQYPDIASSGLDPLTHYMQYGWKEGRSPNAMISGTAIVESLGELVTPFYFFSLLEKCNS